jgi:nucleoside-diphosphate-sugar epimerase
VHVLAPEVRPREEARSLVRSSVQGADRVLVTGGSGWFGRTALALLWHAFGDEWVRRQVLATASATRAIDILGCGRYEVRLVDPVEVADFAPTLIINCAFPTRDRVAGMGLGPYVALARRLTRTFLEYSELPSVQRVVTFSSGAAVPSSTYPADLDVNPYGVLKAHEERATLGLAQRAGINARVCRVWAVSGPHVQHPRNYAFSQFMVQAREAGRIRVAADRPVIRAYASVDDALAVTLAAVSTGSGLFDTGGQRIELGDLATQIATVLGGVPVERTTLDPTVLADDYRAQGAAWQRICQDLDLAPAPLTEQIVATAAAVRYWK